MVKFARSGGEANALAIRIARAASGKDQVAVCGYHGWHDWYLSINLNSDSKDGLSDHLLPGLTPDGVPENLRNTVFPFAYNNFDELKTLVAEKQIGVIKMEVMRNKGPENGFLSKVRQLATDNGIVLIFDECTSGFRETFGGIHKKFEVEPDIAMFGKALGNGYAITAVVGRRDVMEAAQNTFISSTFWTERIGPTAALKTLEVMERDRTWETINQVGSKIRSGIEAVAGMHKLDITSWGLQALTGYSFDSTKDKEYKTLVTQEMLKKGFLAANSTYVSIAHSANLVDQYLETLDPIFGLIAECEQGRNVDLLLEGPVCHSGFKRLN
jgi:glutamate-1-semialdehyde 2,1-aminomutase